MTDQLTPLGVQERLEAYRRSVASWLEGRLDDAGLHRAACDHLYFDHAGVDKAAEIRRRADGSPEWLTLKGAWVEATLLHCRLRDIAAELCQSPWLGGDSLAEVRGAFYEMATSMTLSEAEMARRQLGLY